MKKVMITWHILLFPSTINGKKDGKLGNIIEDIIMKGECEKNIVEEE